MNHGSTFEWTIDRSYKDFLHLHQTLLDYAPYFPIDSDPERCVNS